MMSPAAAMNWEDFNESLPAYLTIAVMPLTYSIANGVVAGLLAYLVIDMLTRAWWVPIVRRYYGVKEDSLSEPLSRASSQQSLRRPSVVASPHAVCRPALPASGPDLPVGELPPPMGALPPEQGHPSSRPTQLSKRSCSVNAMSEPRR